MATAELGEVRKRLINNLKKFRKIRDFTQEELAERAGLSTAFISSIETGRKFLSPETLDKLARALDVDMSQLIASPGASGTGNDVIDAEMAADLPPPRTRRK